jgi:hypothetical protein
MFTKMKFTGLAMLAVAASCATHSPVREMQAGRFEQARVVATAAAKQEKDLGQLDLGMIEVAAGNAKAAFEHFNDALPKIEHVWKENRKSLATYVERAQSLLQIGKIPYEGDDHEMLLAHSIRALLAWIVETDGDAGRALAFADEATARMGDRLSKRGQQGSPESPQCTSIAEFVAGMAYEELPRVRNLHEARKWYDAAHRTEPTPAVADAVARVGGDGNGSESPSSPVYVFLFEGPRFERQIEHARVSKVINEKVRSTANPVLTKAIQANGDAMFKLPRLVEVENGISSAHLAVDGGPALSMPLLSDLEASSRADFALARERCETDQLIALGVRSTGGLLGGIGAGLMFATNLMDQGDSRCWRLMPSRIRLLRLELPYGEHTVDIALAPNGKTVQSGVRLGFVDRVKRDGFMAAVFGNARPESADYRLEAVQSVGTSKRSVRLEVQPGRASLVLAFAPSANALGALISPDEVKSGAAAKVAAVADAPAAGLAETSSK